MEDDPSRKVNGNWRKMSGREMMVLNTGGKKARMNSKRKRVVGNCMQKRW